jgi:hypothetical protein
MTYAEAIECMKKAASVPAADCSYGEKSICFGAGILDAGKMVELASGGECGGEPLEVEDDEKIPDENIENPDNGTDQESPDDNEQIETPDSSPVVDKDEISDSSDINEQSDNAPIPEDESTGCSVIAL